MGVGSFSMKSPVPVFPLVLYELLNFDHLFFLIEILVSPLGSRLLAIAALDELSEILCEAIMVL